jgi:hypothetical protein
LTIGYRRKSDNQLPFRYVNGSTML